MRCSERTEIKKLWLKCKDVAFGNWELEETRKDEKILKFLNLHCENANNAV